MANNKIDKKLQDLAEKSQKNLDYTQSILSSIPADQQKSLEEIKKLLQNNLEFSKTIYNAVVKVQRWIFWQRIFRVLKWIIIIIPIILGIIYFPVLSDIISEFQENLNIIKQSQEALKQLMN